MAKAPQAQQEQFQINHGLTLRPPATEEAIPIPLPDWRRIMNRIENCGEKTGTYESIGWTAVGVACSAAISAFTTWGSVDFSKTIIDKNGNNVTSINWIGVFALSFCIVGSVAGFLVAWLSLKFAKQHSADRADSRQSILFDMRHIEERHPPRTVATATTTPSPSVISSPMASSAAPNPT